MPFYFAELRNFMYFDEIIIFGRNRLNIFIFAILSVFEKNFCEKHYIFCKHNNYFKPPRVFVPVLNIFSEKKLSKKPNKFAKTLWRKIFQRKFFTEPSIFANIFAKICQKLMSSNYFHKMVPLLHMFLKNCVFLKKLRQDFCECLHLCTSDFSQIFSRKSENNVFFNPI